MAMYNVGVEVSIDIPDKWFDQYWHTWFNNNKDKVIARLRNEFFISFHPASVYGYNIAYMSLDQARNLCNKYYGPVDDTA